MTTKLEFIFQAGPEDENGSRDWEIVTNIIPATDESDPGATPEIKRAEANLAEKLQDLLIRALKAMDEAAK